MSEEVFLRGDGPLQPEESVVLHAGLPQVLTSSVVDHVETQQRLPSLCLRVRKKPKTKQHNSLFDVELRFFLNLFSSFGKSFVSNSCLVSPFFTLVLFGQPALISLCVVFSDEIFLQNFILFKFIPSL